MGNRRSHQKETHHDLSCATRLECVRQPPLFFSFTTVVHSYHDHGTVVLKFTSALAQFRYRAPPESGGGCHRTLRRPLPHRKTSAADFYFGWAVLLPFNLAAKVEQISCHRPPHLQSPNISKFLHPKASHEFDGAPYLSTLSLGSRECKTNSVFH